MAITLNKAQSDLEAIGLNRFFPAEYQSIAVVSQLPVFNDLGTNSVFLTTDAKIYRFNGVVWTKIVEAADIDGRGLSILDPNTGQPVFSSDGQIGPTAKINVNGNNVLLSALAAGSIVPSLNFVGAFSNAPTEATLGAQWVQNAVYRNTTDNQLYVLTGSPLGWVLYLEDGLSFNLLIESTNGTVFRISENKSTLLKARLFKNGAEITQQTPATWFRWRRVSAIPRPAPNDDATWDSLYVSGYKEITINVDSVYARATFFCDVISP